MSEIIVLSYDANAENSVNVANDGWGQAESLIRSTFCDRHLPDANCTAKFRPPYAYGFAVASRILRWRVAATDNNERPSTVSRRNLHILNEGKCIFITGACV